MIVFAGDFKEFAKLWESSPKLGLLKLLKTLTKKLVKEFALKQSFSPLSETSGGTCHLWHEALCNNSSRL